MNIAKYMYHLSQVNKDYKHKELEKLRKEWVQLFFLIPQDPDRYYNIMVSL